MSLIWILEFIFGCRRKPKRRARSLTLLIGRIGETNMAKAVVHLGDAGLKAVLQATDNAGNAVTLPSAPVWSLSADGIVDMTVADDGMSAAFAIVAVGDVTVDVVAEADPTPGVNTLHATGDISVLAAEATKLDLSFTTV